ncbi:unnamed protein product, partial [Gulo gulo]
RLPNSSSASTSAFSRRRGTAPPRRLTGHVVRRAHLPLPPPFKAQASRTPSRLPADRDPVCSCGLGAQPEDEEPPFRRFIARPPFQPPSTALPSLGARQGHQPVRTLTRRTPAGLGLARVLLGNGPSPAAVRQFLLRLVCPSRTSGALDDGPGCAACGAAEAKEMGIPPRRSRSGCLLWGSGGAFEETGSPW